MREAVFPCRRVVITGVGLVTPVGHTAAESWDALLRGTSGAGLISQFEATEDFPTRFACEVKNFDATPYLDAKEIRRLDRFAQLALVAAAEAMESGRLDGRPPAVPPERFGVIFGSGIGGISTFEEQARTLVEKGPRRISPFFVPMFIPDIAAGLISIRYCAQGPNFATVSACASSAHAIGDAFRVIQRGEADIMITGGAEATVTPLSVAGFSAMKALSTRNDSPDTASRPFDATRDGFVLGEGAGCLILESLEQAEKRGADPIAEIVGFGQSADAYHITAPAPGGFGARLAMSLALRDAGVTPQEVGYINAHGTSTPQNDSSETAAIKAVFGESAYKLVIGSTKSMTGHLLGAAGAVEAVIAAFVCKRSVIPPTINFTTPDPECDLDYAHNRKVERPVRVALTNSFGFGGHNACLVIRRWEG
ncbi:MAG: beta-ketoacyl-ACP synthase II [Gemmatimonadetes bacterium]|nr:beta-ketoacyl-ACP synthase II [Gemmatimonadota bacterium]